ncbi:MAG: carbon storage regulator [Planctomycetaceae bacterium]
MLTLTRKDGEGIQIGEGIRLFVRMRGNHCQIVIDAPREVAIKRSEFTETPTLAHYIEQREPKAARRSKIG